MNRPDDEFEDFLTRRKPIFSRSAEEPLEPPDEVDRLVLHQAREAVEGARPTRVFRSPRWGAPLAVAATLVLALTVILQTGMPAKPEPIPEVTVQTVAQRLDYPAAAAPAPAPAANNRARAEVARPAEAAVAAENSDSSFSVDLGPDAMSAPARTGGLVSEGEAERYARTPASAPAPGVLVEDPVTGSQAVIVDAAPPPTEVERAMAKASPPPAFRADSKGWLAEIDRLRAAGKGAQAEAEYAEYKRQHRAYAVSPDR
ncbi:MAG: hypothetical protein ABI821_08095 [Pseudomonadota bacterium]